MITSYITPTLCFLFLYCVADPPGIPSHSKALKDAVPDTPTSLTTRVRPKESEVSAIQVQTTYNIMFESFGLAYRDSDYTALIAIYHALT